MRKILFTVALTVATLFASAAAKATIEQPANKYPTSFAIVIDSDTYAACRLEVNAYRAALGRDGLAVYVISAAWTSPDEIRAELQKLYKKNSKKMPLEGVVFIGDVPYVGVQNAQHMTTAFKMNEERFPIEETAVTSDRFYDDLNLEFEFIKRDSINPLRFYYKLAESSAQTLNPSFYSGRIHYPEQMGGDKYKEISRYLRKVVQERRRLEKIDHLVTYAGAAYNSDCLVAWMDERLAIDEMFPQLSERNDVAQLTQLNFRMKDAKEQLFDQIERREVDVMIFNEHGSPDKQHLDGSEPIEGFDRRAEALRDEVYYYLKREQRKENGDVAGAKEYFKEKYRLTDKFFEEFDNPTPKEKKNIDDLVLEEINELRPMPRFVIFNACYNGSFHQKGYVAGSYIFGRGRTVVAQGNTVNVLQDRWTYEMLGLLSNGVRVGQYNRMIATLEGHIIGDPAFHFVPNDENALRQEMVTMRLTGGKHDAKNAQYWSELKDAPNADVQSLALRQLADGGKLSAEELLEKYRTCNYATTRMECLKLLSRYGGECEEFVTAVAEALYDSYELVRRNAARYASMIGAESLLDECADVMLNRPESQRVAFTLNNMWQVMPEKATENALESVIAKSGYPVQGYFDDLRKGVARMQRMQSSDVKTAFDKEAKPASRVGAIRGFRNSQYHHTAPQMVALVADENEPVEVRVAAAEALGWFNLSCRRSEIVKGLQGVSVSDKALAAEIEQTLNRLK